MMGAILRHMAHDKFKRNIDSYTVRYLASQNKFTTDDFENLKINYGTVPIFKNTFLNPFNSSLGR